MKSAVLLLLPLLLQACGNSAPEAPEASVSVGIDRSVADVRAAEAAASGPVTFAPSVAELSDRDGKAPAGE